MNKTALPNGNILFLVSPIGTLWRSYPYIEPPYGAALVVSGLRNQGWGVSFVDLDLQLNHWQAKKLLLGKETLALLQDWPRLLEEMDRLPKDLNLLLKRMIDFIEPSTYHYIALSLSRLSKKTKVYDVEFGFSLALARFIQSVNPCPIIFGGQNMSKIGRHSVEQGIIHAMEKCVDFLFYNDGAISLPILMNALSNNTGSDFLELDTHLRKTNAHATWWQAPGKIKSLGNDLRLPAVSKNGPVSTSQKSKFALERDLLKIKPSFSVRNADLYPVNVNQIFHSETHEKWATEPIYIFPYKFMFGCSHKCAFCKGAYQPLIARSVGEVVDDLQFFVEKEGARYFRFFNSQINYARKYVEQFCNEIVRRNLKLSFIDSANLRYLDPDVCRMLREAGCVKLWFGLESPIERVLRLIDKRLNLDNAMIAIQNADDAGIWIGMNLILGFPHESDAEFKEICGFIESRRNIVDCWNFSALQVYDETPMYAYPAEYGIEIHHRYRGEMRDKGYAFSEIDGLEWNAREKRARTRADDCQHLVGVDENRFKTNDYLIFALYREFQDKKRVRIHLDRFLKTLERSMSLSDGSKWITPNKVLGFDSSSFLKQMDNRSIN